MRSASCSGAVAAVAIAAALHFSWQNSIPSVQQLMVDRADVSSYVRSGSFFNDNGRAIFYRVAGNSSSKPWLLLLHGFPTSSLDWLAIESSLSSNFSVLSFDFLGFGLSDKPTGHTYLLQEQAGIAERLMKQLGIHDVHILAHDYGTSVAQELLARGIEQVHPAWSGAARDVHTGVAPHRNWELQVHSVVLLNGGILAEHHRPLLMQRLLSNRFTGPIIARIGMHAWTFTKSLNRVFGPRTQLSAGDALPHWVLLAHKQGTLALPQLLAYMSERRQYSGRWRDALFFSRAPVAVVNGPADPVSGAHLFAAYLQQRDVYMRDIRATVGAGLVKGSPAGDAHVLAARDGDAAVALPAHIGHYPQLEAPEETMRAIRAFHDAVLTQLE